MKKNYNNNNLNKVWNENNLDGAIFPKWNAQKIMFKQIAIDYSFGSKNL